MGKVKGPLFGLSASGTIADTLTYAQWKGRPYARERVIPANPRSAAQIGVRTNLTNVVSEWHHPERTREDRTAYNVPARRDRISGYNYFARFYLRVLNDDRSPVYYRGITATKNPDDTLTVSGKVSEADSEILVKIYNRNQVQIGQETTTATGTTINATTTGTYSDAHYVELIDASEKPNGKSGWYTVS